MDLTLKKGDLVYIKGQDELLKVIRLSYTDHSSFDEATAFYYVSNGISKTVSILDLISSVRHMGDLELAFNRSAPMTEENIKANRVYSKLKPI